MGPRLGGPVSNDTLAPLRALTGGGRTAHRARRPPPRAPASAVAGRPAGCRPAPARRPRPAAGRCCPSSRPTRPGARTPSAEALLDRHGVVTRGAVVSERVPGGFAGVYKVLSAFEESGRCRRGYFVAGLGAAQFGAAGRRRPAAVVLRASAPTAVAAAPSDRQRGRGRWPPPTRQPVRRRAALARAAPTTPGHATGHRPGRKAGALVVLVDGALALYVERGGRTLLTFTDDAECSHPPLDALAAAVAEGALGRLTVERADGEHILAHRRRAGALRRGARGGRLRRRRRAGCGCAADLREERRVPEGDTVWRTARTSTRRSAARC